MKRNLAFILFALTIAIYTLNGYTIDAKNQDSQERLIRKVDYYEGEINAIFEYEY